MNRRGSWLEQVPRLFAHEQIQLPLEKGRKPYVPRHSSISNIQDDRVATQDLRRVTIRVIAKLGLLLLGRQEIDDSLVFNRILLLPVDPLPAHPRGDRAKSFHSQTHKTPVG